jgi:hypothetical protein
MISFKRPMMKTESHFPSRRHFLHSSSLGLKWLAFSALAARTASQAMASAPVSGLAPKSTHFPARAKHVIFLTMRGGPSHVDLLDFKPDLIKNSGKMAKIGRDSLGAKLLGPAHPFAPYGRSGLQLSTLLPHIGAPCRRTLCDQFDAYRRAESFAGLCPDAYGQFSVCASFARSLDRLRARERE